MLTFHIAIYSIVLVLNICVVIFMLSQIVLPALKSACKNTILGRCMYAIEKNIFSACNNILQMISFILLGKEDRDKQEDESHCDNKDEHNIVENNSNSLVSFDDANDIDTEINEKTITESNNNSLGSSIAKCGIDKEIQTSDIDISYSKRLPTIIVSLETTDIVKENTKNKIIATTNTSTKVARDHIPSVSVDFSNVTAESVEINAHTKRIKKHRQNIRIMKNFLSK